MQDSLLVVCRYLPTDDGEDASESKNEFNGPGLDDRAQQNDTLDDFNHPRFRRSAILRELESRRKDYDFEVIFEKPTGPVQNLSAYQQVQKKELLEFFETAWDRFVAFESNREGERPSKIIPDNVPLPRYPHQRPSQHVMGQIGYYCTDVFTPIFPELKGELCWDAAVIDHALEAIQRHRLVYALAAHPGHHAAAESFGGYCYLNNAAYSAKKLQESLPCSKVAVLDVDYHCGNGTSSILYSDPTVLMISIHCHPDHEYPFHSGFEEETGTDGAEGTNMFLPLLPGTDWEAYNHTLEKAVKKIQSFGAEALVLSLGLDTYENDPIARSGFKLSGKDYFEMGQWIGSHCQIPTIVIQEGGYKMDIVANAAADVVYGCTQSK